MPRFQLVTVKSVPHLRNALKYVSRADHNLAGSVGAVNFYLPEHRADLGGCFYKQAKRMLDYHPLQYARYALHLTIQFAPPENQFLNERKALYIGYYISMTYFKDCMSCFCVHTNTNNMHLHYVLIPYNIYNGTSVGIPREGWWKIMFGLTDYMHTRMMIPLDALQKGSICHGIESG